MNTVAMAGATGVVGRQVLRALLDRRDVDHVVSAGRRPVPQEHPKLASVVVDLQDSAAIAAALPQVVDVGICCLGTTMKQAGSKDAFRAVDFDAVMAFAKAVRSRGARRFVLVSSVGADAGARTFYLQVKGEAEQAVAGLGFSLVTIVRPSFLDDHGTRGEHRIGERLALPVARAVFAVLGKTRRYAPIDVDVVARAVVRLAFDEGGDGIRIVESERLHALGDASG